MNLYTGRCLRMNIFTLSTSLVGTQYFVVLRTNEVPPFCACNEIPPLTHLESVAGGWGGQPRCAASKVLLPGQGDAPRKDASPARAAAVDIMGFIEDLD